MSRDVGNVLNLVKAERGESASSSDDVERLDDSLKLIVNKIDRWRLIFDFVVILFS